jgi:arylsulfatase A-like enzyme/Flp pilus assembly protein TadD
MIMKKKLFILITACIFFIVVVILLWQIKVGKEVPVNAKGLNLLVITLDTTRSDHIGAYGYPKAVTPNLDKLAKEGTLFENCYSPVPLTLPAHCSLFTGKYPLGHKVRNNGTYYLAEDNKTLAERFSVEGYQTYAVISSYVLMSKFGLNQGFATYDDTLDIGKLMHNFESEIKADLVFRKFNEWFSTREKENKFFAWVHFYDAHQPYEPPDEYRKIIGDESLIGLYDGELAFMDVYVGKIIQLLKQENELSNTVILLVGDHGEAFGEHVAYGHSIFCYEIDLKVPLIFYNPKLFKQNLRIQERVNLVDIMPTILKIFRMGEGNDFQGTDFSSLFSGRPSAEQRVFYFESIRGQEEMGWAPLTGIIDENYKYISLPQAELYDLNVDADEHHNLFLKKNQLAKKLDKKLMNLVKKYSSSQTGPDAKRELNLADKKHLQSLGYISTFSQKGHANIDPKVGISIKRQYESIESLIKNGNIQLAKTHLAELRKKYPETMVPQYFWLMNSIYEKEEDKRKILENWENAMKYFPENDSIALNLALEYFDQKQSDASEGIINQIIKKDPKNSSALILLARICKQKGKNQQATRYYERAQKLEPMNFSLELQYAKLLSEENQSEKAEEICNRLLKNETVMKNVNLKCQIGIILTEINRNEKAYQILSETAIEKKDNAELWNYLGILYLRKKEYQDAEKAFLESIRLDKHIAKTYNNLGTLYLSKFLKYRTTQLHQLALDSFNEALKIDPKLASALNGRASAYVFARQIQNAIRDWELVIKIKPDFVDAYFNIAITFMQIGKKRKALNYLQMCQDKNFEKLNQQERNRLSKLIQEAKS